MDDDVPRGRRSRRYFSPAFKAQTVELIRESGKTIPEVCRDLDLSETAVRRWVAWTTSRTQLRRAPRG